MTLDFFIPCVPPKATSQGKGAFRCGNGIRFFKKKNVKQAEDTMVTLLAPHQPAEPLRGPVSLAVEWTFPYRKSEKKKLVALGLPIPCDTRPDLDNLNKMIGDALVTLCFIEDDGKIYDLHLRKYWGATPGIYIKITTVCHTTQ